MDRLFKATITKTYASGFVANKGNSYSLSELTKNMGWSSIVKNFREEFSSKEAIYGKTKMTIMTPKEREEIISNFSPLIIAEDIKDNDIEYEIIQYPKLIYLKKRKFKGKTLYWKNQKTYKQLMEMTKCLNLPKL